MLQGLKIGNSDLNFAEFQSLVEQLGDDIDYNLLWTYQPGLQQGVLQIALDAAAPATGFIAYGIPKKPEIMKDGSAIVVKANRSAPAGMVNKYPLFDAKQEHQKEVE